MEQFTSQLAWSPAGSTAQAIAQKFTGHIEVAAHYSRRRNCQPVAAAPHNTQLALKQHTDQMVIAPQLAEEEQSELEPSLLAAAKEAQLAASS